MKNEIVSIYENIYNQELNWKSTLDNKFASRLTLLLTLTTATVVIFTTIFFPGNNKNVISSAAVITAYKLISAVTLVLVIFAFIAFYNCFFRMKLNYRVMPTVDIRMFHFYIHRNNLLGTSEENDLYDYLNDSYQFCAYNNAEINGKREKALIKFDNLSSVSFIILIIMYIFMISSGYSISWIF